MFFIYFNPADNLILPSFLTCFRFKAIPWLFQCCMLSVFWWPNPLLDGWEMHICHKNIFDVCLFSCWTACFWSFLRRLALFYIFKLWIILCLNLHMKLISIQIFWQCNDNLKRSISWKGLLDVLRCHKQSCVFTYKTLWRSEIIIKISY